MILSVGFVVSLFSWCIFKVLTTGSDDTSMAHIEPVEQEEADQR